MDELDRASNLSWVQWENFQLWCQNQKRFAALGFSYLPCPMKIIWRLWWLPQVTFLWQSAIRQNSPQRGLWRRNMHKARVNPPHIEGWPLFYDHSPANTTMTIFLWAHTGHCRMAGGAEALSNWVPRSLSERSYFEAWTRVEHFTLFSTALDTAGLVMLKEGDAS